MSDIHFYNNVQVTDSTISGNNMSSANLVPYMGHDIFIHGCKKFVLRITKTKKTADVKAKQC